jgi:hypothetical protein
MNQLELPSSGPTLELSLSGDHFCRFVELLHEHQSRNSVFPGESFN